MQLKMSQMNIFHVKSWEMDVNKDKMPRCLWRLALVGAFLHYNPKEKYFTII